MRQLRKFPFVHSRLLVAVLSCFVAGAPAAQEHDLSEIVDLPFEQLLKTEVVTADKLARQISDAPSAVSVVTAEDIRTFGYRTLGDILNSMRGLSVSHDQMYGYLSGRGFSIPGGYSGRITLLIDGYRATDNVYGQIYFGNDGILDVELIERVEYIPGSGSGSYGDSAFLGVINIVTKKGRDINGTQVSGEMGSHGLRRDRVTYGKQFDNGLDVVFSASMLRQGGRYLPAELDISGGFPVEKEKNQRYFLKAAYQGWAFESALAERRIDNPGYDADDFLQGESPIFDKNAYATLKYDGELGDRLKSSTQLYLGRYRYEIYSNGSLGRTTAGDWWGLDSKLVATWFDKHTLALGAEYRDDYRQGKIYSYMPEHNWQTNRATVSAYAYDDIALDPKLTFTLGARVDARDSGSTTYSPRAALVYTPLIGTTLKLSTGESSRQQTPFEEYRLSNPRAEHLYTNELVLEQSLGPKSRLLASAYRYRVQNQYADYRQDADGVYFFDYTSLVAKGFELELEHLWDNGIRLQGSYAMQQCELGNNMRMANLARNTAKLNLSAPIYGDALRAGLGVRYTGPHLNKIVANDPATVLADFTLSSRWNHWFAAFSIRNLGNVHYKEIGYDFYGNYQNGATGSYPADGRTYWLQLGYEFR